MNLNTILEKEKDQEELKTLIAETKELNDLMRSYIKVQMDRDSINHQSVLKEIQAIEEASKQAQNQMISMLEKQKNISVNQLVKMQEVSESYLSLMQEQEKSSREKLENLNEQIIENTKEGLNLVDQNVTNIKDELIKSIGKVFKETNSTVNSLKKNIENTNFQDKIKIAIPFAVMASAITLGGYALIRIIEGLF